MNNDRIDPFLGEYDGNDDLAGLDISFLNDCSDELGGTIYTQGPVSCQPPQDTVPLHFNDLHYEDTNDKTVVVKGETPWIFPDPNIPLVKRENALPQLNPPDQNIHVGEGQNVLTPWNLPVSNIPVEQAVKPKMLIIENALESFERKSFKPHFHIEESTRPKNKPYAEEDKILFTKPWNAVKIKAVGAQIGQRVKMSMRYKTKTHYQQPVLACSAHQEQNGQNPGATFYVSQKIAVEYMLENNHPTALIPLTEEEDFCFHPIFRCWNFCGKKFGKSQEMVLTLMMGNEVLHETSFDVRVCENVGRDLRQYKEERDGKRPRKAAAKRPRHLMEPEAQAIEHLQEAGPPPSKPRYFMVKLVDGELVPTLEALTKVRGGDMAELVDPAFHPEKYFQ